MILFELTGWQSRLEMTDDSPCASSALKIPGLNCGPETNGGAKIRARRVGILQSNYIPWKGYFDIIHSVDEFILFDTAQYTRNDWRNRNRIKTQAGLAWLTIPIKNRFPQMIQEAELKDPSWNARHWKTLAQNYSRAQFFQMYRTRFEELYADCNETLLSRVNHRFLTAICDMLGIKTHFSWSSEYPEIEGKTERLVGWCKLLNATEYLTGPAAKTYIDEGLFVKAGIELRYMDYSGYPEYRQLYPPFEHAVSIVDLIFNEGPDAPRYMKSF
jgi:WbqC-like protein